MAWADAIVHSHSRNNYARILFVAGGKGGIRVFRIYGRSR